MEVCGAVRSKKFHDVGYDDLQQLIVSTFRVPAMSAAAELWFHFFHGNSDLQQLYRIGRESLKGQVLQQLQDLELQKHSL